MKNDARPHTLHLVNKPGDNKPYTPNRELTPRARRALRAKVNLASIRPAMGTSELLASNAGGTYSLPGSKKDVETHDLVGVLIPQHLKN